MLTIIPPTPHEEEAQTKCIDNLEEGEKIPTKGTDSLFNRIIAENFP
jgi:hypothetical protein